MTSRLLKEARALGPYFVLAVALGTLPCWVWKENGREIALFGFGLGCALMAGVTFGSEFQLRTFPMLLSQPVGRGAIWAEKMLALAGAMGAALVVAAAVISRPALLTSDHTIVLVMVLLCALCGVPALTLATRSGIAGMSFGAVIPPLLVGVGVNLNERYFHWPAGERLPGGILAAYCAAALALGFAQLKRLQLAGGAGVVLDSWRPLERLLPGAEAAGAGAGQGIANLLRKESRLQGATFVLTALLAALALVAAALSSAAPETAGLFRDGAFMICVFLLPLLAGALAVAEERGWGMAEWHLTLPIPAWKQWVVKMGVAMTVGLGLGALLPMLFLWGRSGFTTPSGGGEVVFFVLNYSVVAVSAAAFAGTFSNSSLRALLVAIGLVVGLGLCWELAFQTLQGLMQGAIYLLPRPSQAMAHVTIACAVLVIALQVFAFRRFRARTSRNMVLWEILFLFAFVYVFMVYAESSLFVDG